MPKIYADSSENGRYGYIASNEIKCNNYFSSLILELDKIDFPNGIVKADVRAKTENGQYTEWFPIREEKNNEVLFLLYDRYVYMQFRVSIVTGSIKDAPIIKSISIEVKK